MKARIEPYRTLVELYKHSYNFFTVYNRIEGDSLEKLGFEKDKIIILPPMIDFEVFLTLERTHVDDALVIGVIGRISPEKGIHRTVFIARDLLNQNAGLFRNVKFVLTGRIDNREYGQLVISELRRLLGQRFIYMGEVAPPFEFYRNVDIVLIPSLIETGAIAVLEAMAAGKIVIASNIYPINLYISNGRNGFLFNTTSDVAKIILEILNGDIDVKPIAKEAKRYAQKHDYKVVCQRLEKVYRYAET